MKTNQKLIIFICLNIFGILVILVAGILLALNPDDAEQETDAPEPQANQPNTTVNDNEDVQITSDFKFTLENFPRIDGSTSNVPLRSYIICATLNYECSWQEYEFTEGGDSKERYVDIKASEQDLEIIRKRSVNSTTHNAYVKLINGETDLILVATLPSEEETALMNDKNVELIVTPIAMDAFVFIVNQDNPVNTLSIEQILNVYTGKTTNWKDLGGKNITINPYQREDNSGSQELMRTLVLKEVKPIGAPEMTISGMIGLINRVADDKYGLGYSVYYYEQFMVPNDKLKLLQINGVAPNYDTLKDKSYPLVAPVYLVTQKNLADQTPAAELAKWLKSEAGQQIVKQSGYVPQNAK